MHVHNSMCAASSSASTESSGKTLDRSAELFDMNRSFASHKAGMKCWTLRVRQLVVPIPRKDLENQPGYWKFQRKLNMSKIRTSVLRSSGFFCISWFCCLAAMAISHGTVRRGRALFFKVSIKDCSSKSASPRPRHCCRIPAGSGFVFDEGRVRAGTVYPGISKPVSPCFNTNHIKQYL